MAMAMVWVAIRLDDHSAGRRVAAMCRDDDAAAGAECDDAHEEEAGEAKVHGGSKDRKNRGVRNVPRAMSLTPHAGARCCQRSQAAATVSHD